MLERVKKFGRRLNSKRKTSAYRAVNKDIASFKAALKKNPNDKNLQEGLKDLESLQAQRRQKK